MNRRAFLTASAVLGVATLTMKTTPYLSTEILVDGNWTWVPGGLLHVRRGQRFRTIDPRTNKMCIEATATDDGEPGLDAIGQQCGQVYFDESTAVYEGAS